MNDLGLLILLIAFTVGILSDPFLKKVDPKGKVDSFIEKWILK